MPDVTQAEVGRRLYHVHREKTAEGAVRLMQQGIGAEWKKFTKEDISLLMHLIQCTWNVIDQKAWDRIPFAKISAFEVQPILLQGDGVAPGRNPQPEQVEAIRTLLLTKT